MTEAMQGSRSTGRHRETSHHPEARSKLPQWTPENDAVYAERFYRRYLLRPQMREQIVENVGDMITDGSLHIPLSHLGTSPFDKEKISAYREAARAQGYEVGGLTIDAQSHFASAVLTQKV